MIRSLVLLSTQAPPLQKFNSLGYNIYATVYINYKLLWLVVDSHMVRVVLYNLVVDRCLATKGKLPDTRGIWVIIG